MASSGIAHWSVCRAVTDHRHHSLAVCQLADELLGLIVRDGLPAGGKLDRLPASRAATDCVTDRCMAEAGR